MEHLNIRLSKHDKDIRDWLEQQADKSKAVKVALRAWMNRDQTQDAGPTVLDAMAEMHQDQTDQITQLKLTGIAATPVATDNGDGDWRDSPETKANLALLDESWQPDLTGLSAHTQRKAGKQSKITESVYAGPGQVRSA